MHSICANFSRYIFHYLIFTVVERCNNSVRGRRELVSKRSPDFRYVHVHEGLERYSTEAVGYVNVTLGRAAHLVADLRSEIVRIVHRGPGT